MRTIHESRRRAPAITVPAPLRTPAERVSTTTWPAHTAAAIGETPVIEQTLDALEAAVPISLDGSGG